MAQQTMVDLSAEQTIANAPTLVEQFERLIEHVGLEKKGIRFSEMFFLYCTVRGLAPGQIVESGRARAQSTLVLSLCFPDVPIVSIERNAKSEDVPVAEARLAGRANVDCVFGDSRVLMPRLVRPGDIVLIDGPKDLRALKLAILLLRRNDPSVVFVHDCAAGSRARLFLERNVPHAIFADAPGFLRQYGYLDRDKAGETRGLACIPRRGGFPGPRLRWRLLVARWAGNLRQSTAKRLETVPLRRQGESDCSTR